MNKSRQQQQFVYSKQEVIIGGGLTGLIDRLFFTRLFIIVRVNCHRLIVITATSHLIAKYRYRTYLYRVNQLIIAL